MNKKREREILTEAKQRLLCLELYLGKVLMNKANGFVYLRNGVQVKINIGKSRKNRDFNFSHPHFWRVLSWWESLLVKSGLYKFIKIDF